MTNITEYLYANGYYVGPRVWIAPDGVMTAEQHVCAVCGAFCSCFAKHPPHHSGDPIEYRCADCAPGWLPSEAA